MPANLQVTLSADVMTATVSGSGIEMTKRHAEAAIRNALIESGVIEGFLEDSILQGAYHLAAGGKLEPTIMAVGQPPHAGLLPGAHFDARVYDHAQLPSDPGHSEGIMYAALRQKLDRPDIVSAQMRVGRFARGEPPASGYTVTGKVIPIPVHAKPQDGFREIGEFLLTNSTGDIVAARTGILVQHSGICSLVPVTLQGGFSVELSPDRLNASVIIYPAAPGYTNPSVQEIRTHLQHRHIRNADYKKVESLLFLAVDKGTVCRTVVAEGTPSSKGIDGRAEFFVDLEFHHRPTIREDGRADYYSVHQFEAVTKDQPLVRMHPPTKGEPGVDVVGNRIEAPPGDAPRLRLGRGVRVWEKDPFVVVANRNGHVYLKKDLLLVEGVLQIPSDVNFRTGNIHFPGDVVVTGDVRSGFMVRAQGNVRVFGTVEDATIISGGHTVITAGFVGQGKGVIRAGGDVVAGFVHSQTIAARGTVMIAGEVMDATLLAGDSVLVESLKSVIVGGEVTARNTVRCQNLGGESAKVTRVRAGLDHTVLRRLDHLQAKLMHMQTDRQTRSGELEALLREALTHGGLSSEKGFVRARLHACMQDLEQNISRVNTTLGNLRRMVHNFEARVLVNGKVHPHVSVEIANISFASHEELRHCQFFVDQGVVRCQPQ